MRSRRNGAEVGAATQGGCVRFVQSGRRPRPSQPRTLMNTARGVARWVGSGEHRRVIFGWRLSGSADPSIPRRDIRAWSHMITHGRCRRDSQTAPWLSDRNDPAFDAKALEGQRHPMSSARQHLNPAEPHPAPEPPPETPRSGPSRCVSPDSRPTGLPEADAPRDAPPQTRHVRRWIELEADPSEVRREVAVEHIHLRRNQRERQLGTEPDQVEVQSNPDITCPGLVLLTRHERPRGTVVRRTFEGARAHPSSTPARSEQHVASKPACSCRVDSYLAPASVAVGCPASDAGRSFGTCRVSTKYGNCGAASNVSSFPRNTYPGFVQ